MMSTTSTRKISKHNSKRALIRIQKELQYISIKRYGNPDAKNIRKAIYHIVQAILTD